MGYRSDDQFIVYPIYFDKQVSRKDGRRLSLKHSIDKPSVDQIAKAAKSLGLQPVIEKERMHSSRPWKKEGRVLVKKTKSKQTLLHQISQRM